MAWRGSRFRPLVTNVQFVVAVVMRFGSSKTCTIPACRIAYNHDNPKSETKAIGASTHGRKTQQA